MRIYYSHELDPSVNGSLVITSIRKGNALDWDYKVLTREVVDALLTRTHAAPSLSEDEVQMIREALDGKVVTIPSRLARKLWEYKYPTGKERQK